MPKKTKAETPAEQSERFEKEAQRLVDAGELNPIEADRIMNKILRPPGQRTNKTHNA